MSSKHFLTSFKYLKNSIRWIAFSSTESRWEVVVGLEVHAQLIANTKLFSGTRAVQVNKSNSNISYLDAGIPGVLPVINAECIRKGIITALALNCTINPISWFDRKHFFCRHMPIGYQITQKNSPLASNGFLEFNVVKRELYFKTSKIKNIRMKTNVGKSVAKTGFNEDVIDLNRAGNALLQIVFEPDFLNSYEAVCLMNELILILKSLRICTCKMENGDLKIDANISVKRKGSHELGPRCKIRNINGLKTLQSILNFEANRQKLLVRSGRPVQSEIRIWNAPNQRTVPNEFMKIDQEYRYMPEPNLPPLKLSMEEKYGVNSNPINVPLLRKNLPELPGKTRRQLMETYKLSIEIANRLLKEQILVNLFLSIMRDKDNEQARKIVEFLLQDFWSAVKLQKLSLKTCKVSLEHIDELIDLKSRDLINRRFAIEVLKELLNGNNTPPLQMIENNHWFQINDSTMLEESCKLAIKANPLMVARYCECKNELLKSKLFKDLFNEAQSYCELKANYKLIKQILIDMLNSRNTD